MLTDEYQCKKRKKEDNMNNDHLDILVANGSIRDYEYVSLDNEGNIGKGRDRNSERLIIYLIGGEKITIECVCSGSSENTSLNIQ